MVAPSAQNQEPDAWRLAVQTQCWAISVLRENTKNNVFCELEHHTALVWRLAANWVPPGGSYTCEPYPFQNNSDFHQFKTP